MLETLRKGAATWVAKILMGLLVLSFGVWGVADIFGGYGRRNVATVGDKEITANEYQEALRRQLQSLRGRMVRSLTMEEARNYGIDRQVLLNLVREAALDNQGEGMNLGISSKAIAERIVREQAFRDASGKFDKNRFLQILQSNGLSEGAFVARQRETYIRQQLVRTVGAPIDLPKTFLDAANLYRNETRRLKYFIIGSDKIEPVDEPTAEKLQKYYDGNKSSYAVPEMRKLGVLAVLPDTVSKTITVKEEDLKARYDNTLETFRVPEKREVRQIPFPDEATAKAAYDKIEAGSSFEDIAKERNLSDEDTNLGLVEKSGLADPVIADAAFSLAEGKVSAPVKGELSTVLLKVDNIEPEKVTPFEEAKAGIRDTIAKERAADAILDLSNQIEDERANGAGLSGIAKKLGLNYRVVDAVGRNGNGPDGKPVKPLPDQKDLLSEAFASEPGLENDPLETGDQGLIWYDVISVTPRKIRPLDEVRAKVEEDWRTSEQRAKLAKKARELVDEARGGKSLEDIASGLGLTVSESAPVKREAKDDKLPAAAIAQAFALPQGGYGSTAVDKGARRVVFQVAAIKAPAPLEETQSEQMTKAFQNQFADDKVAQYVAALVNRYGVTRNQPIINQITGAGDTSSFQ